MKPGEEGQKDAARATEALRQMAPGSSEVTYDYSKAEKLLTFAPSLRQRFMPAKNLFAGPFTGEFGYELMQWQGFIRSRRRHYENVHVLTYPGRDYLYEECTVHYHKIDLKAAGYGYGALEPRVGKEMAADMAGRIGLSNYDLFDPSLLCTRYHRRFWDQDFRLFEEKTKESAHEVVFHFRAVRKEGFDHQKNYSPALADQLVEDCMRRGLSVGCIGHPSYSYCPPGCDDLRRVELRETVTAISNARLVAGENSGPMHLANLCGKPTVLWAQDQWRIDFSLRWNPFRVPIYIAANNTCQPAPGIVADAIAAAMEDLRRRSDDFTRPLYTLPAQPIAKY